MCGAELRHLNITSRFYLMETQVSGSLLLSHALIPKFHVVFKSTQKATSLKLLSRVKHRQQHSSAHEI
jgi:hypothetical protein